MQLCRFCFLWCLCRLVGATHKTQLCSRRGRVMSPTPDKKCVDRCVRKGSKYGLGVDSHVYVLEPQNKAARYAATDVSVTGTLDGETIHIDSIAPNKRAANSKPKN
jgi:hypothetical protein